MDRSNLILNGNTLVSEVLAAGPQAVRFFTDHRMDCVGCRMAHFCTLAEAARNYDLPIEQLLSDFNKTLQS